MELARLRADDPALFRGASGVGTKRAARLKFYVGLFVSDTTAVLAGTTAASLLRFSSLSQDQVQVLAAIMLPMLWVFQLSSLTPETLVDWRRGVGSALVALFGSATVALTVAFFLHYGPELSRLMIVASVGLSALFMIAGRIVIGRLGARIFGGDAVERALILDHVTVPAPSGIRRIDAGVIGLSEDAHHPLALDRLARALEGADVVYVACAPDRRVAWSTALQGSNHHVELIVPEMAEIGVLGGRHFAGMPTIVIGPGRMRGRDEMLKRAFDLALVIPMLVALGPLLAFIAAAIKLDSKGPVLFIQKRVGRGNRIFDVYKFRSMYTELCDRDGNVSASRLDDRVTRVGRFIRATSIDELAQLFNILRGDMSFVGPRPHALGSLAGDALFWEVDQRYHYRHACKPGLTGLAQVRGFRGATHRREDLINRLRADLEYLNGWSLGRDIAILFATAKVVFWRDPELAEEGLPADAANALSSVEVRHVGPVNIVMADRAAAIRIILESVRTHALRTFAFCDARAFGLARRSPDFALALLRATVFGERGPASVAGRLFGADALPAGVESGDVAAAVLSALPRRSRLFIVGNGVTLDAAKSRIAERFAHVDLVGAHHAPIDRVDAEQMAMRIRETRADLVLIGMGSPEQELWAERFGASTGSVILCVASLDIASAFGAPAWIRRSGLRGVGDEIAFARAISNSASKWSPAGHRIPSGADDGPSDWATTPESSEAR